MYKMSAMIIIFILFCSSLVIIISDEVSAEQITLTEDFDDNSAGWWLNSNHINGSNVSIADGNLNFTVTYTNEQEATLNLTSIPDTYALYGTFKVKVAEYNIIWVRLDNHYIRLDCVADGTVTAMITQPGEAISGSTSDAGNPVEGIYSFALIRIQSPADPNKYDYITQIWYNYITILYYYSTEYKHETDQLVEKIYLMVDGLSSPDGYVEVPSITMTYYTFPESYLLNDPEDMTEGSPYFYNPHFTFIPDNITFNTNMVGYSVDDDTFWWMNPEPGTYWLNVITTVDGITETSDNFTITCLDFIETVYNMTLVHTVTVSSFAIDPWIEAHNITVSSIGNQIEYTEAHNLTISSKGVLDISSSDGLNIGALIWILVYFIPIILLGFFLHTYGILFGNAIMAIMFGFTQENAMILLIIGVLVTVVYALFLRGGQD